MTICFRDFGDKAGPVMLLIAGLGEDLTFWTDSFVGSLVTRGFRVVAIDNRDAGQSTFVATPPPALWRQIAARPRGEEPRHRAGAAARPADRPANGGWPARRSPL